TGAWGSLTASAPARRRPSRRSSARSAPSARCRAPGKQAGHRHCGRASLSGRVPGEETRMLEVVTMKEIDAIFAVTDALGVHREMLVIPLGPASPGRVRKLPSGKFEITVDAERPIDEWVQELPRLT